jgi:hypothetical protein
LEFIPKSIKHSTAQRPIFGAARIERPQINECLCLASLQKNLPEQTTSTASDTWKIALYQPFATWTDLYPGGQRRPKCPSGPNPSISSPRQLGTRCRPRRKLALPRTEEHFISATRASSSDLTIAFGQRLSDRAPSLPGRSLC